MIAAAAILAGGRARRFGGRPKPLLPLDGQRIVDRLLAALRAVTDQVFIVANDSETYAGLGAPVHPDVLTGAGPLGGVHAALRVSRSSRTLVVAGDMPFVSAPFLDHLLRCADPAVDVALPRPADGPQPLCACYRPSCAAILERRIAAGALRAADAVLAMRRRELDADEIAPFDPDGVLFLNVNTPADHARARALARQRTDAAEAPQGARSAATTDREWPAPHAPSSHRAGDAGDAATRDGTSTGVRPTAAADRERGR